MWRQVRSNFSHGQVSNLMTEIIKLHLGEKEAGCGPAKGQDGLICAACSCSSLRGFTHADVMAR